MIAGRLTAPAAPSYRAAILLVVMIVTALCSEFVRPMSVAMPHPPLAQLIPASFAGWNVVPDLTQNVVNPETVRQGDLNMSQPYTDVLMRVYGNSRGDRIMLAIAYGAQQRQEVKIHRPELCYTSQGFEILSRRKSTIATAGGQSRATRLLVLAPGRMEAVSYWIRIGDLQNADAVQTRLYLFSQALKGHVVDGVLVRASQIVGSANGSSDGSYQLQERFLSELLASLDPSMRSILFRG